MEGCESKGATTERGKGVMAETTELAAVLDPVEEAHGRDEGSNFYGDASTLYVKEIGALGRLTPQEEVSLAQDMEKGKEALEKLETLDLSDEERAMFQAEVRRGDAAKRRFIESNLRLVVSIARRFVERGLPLDDLIQEGNIGLFRAVEKFDYRRGWRFSTYASWWIRQAVTRAIIDQARTIRLPVHVAEMVSKVMKVSGDLQQDLGREPTTAEISKALDVPEENLRVAFRAVQRPISLELTVGEDDDGYLGDLIEDEQTAPTPEVVGQKLLGEEVRRLLDDLSTRERKVVAMRYGLGGDSFTLDEVGSRLGVTRERVRQIEKGALAKLSRRGHEKGLGEYLYN